MIEDGWLSDDASGKNPCTGGDTRGPAVPTASPTPPALGEKDTDHAFRLLVEAVSDYSVYMLDTAGVVATWNKGAERNKGYTAQEAIGLPFSTFHTVEDRLAGKPAKALATARAQSKFETHGWRVRKDGSRFWARVVIEAIHNADGVHIGFAKVTQDVTIQQRALDQLTRNLDAALSNMSQGLCFFDAAERVILTNAPMAAFCGLATSAPMPGMSFRDVFRAIIDQSETEDGRSLDRICDEHRALIRERKRGNLTLKPNADYVLSVAHSPMPDGSWVMTVEDISERSRSQSRIAHMALHDALTDLPNRLLFRQRLDEALLHVKRGAMAAVLCLDLDRFKTVNDTLGHPTGDALLVSVAARLRELVRDTDVVARLGGDEFAIIQTNIRQPSDATVLADRVIRALNQPIEIEGHRITSGTSIGIALTPQDSLDPDHLLKAADLALYRAKAQGRNRHCYFEMGMDARLQERRLLELDLRTALASGEFEIHYQPIVDMVENAVCGFEALLRWRSPTRGMVSPADFIPLAEETGLIVEIGNWVLETACREAAGWPVPIKVAVNVSVAQFKGFELVEAVHRSLERSGLEPRRLEIEITESIMINDSTHACLVLHALKKIGLSISMDDFGTGYSSLGYLRSFPFDKIKIDQSFVQGLGQTADCNAIIQAVLGICESLGIIATAEGVETEGQMTLLRSRKCHQAQGYLISRPFPASEIRGFLDGFDERWMPQAPSGGSA